MNATRPMVEDDIRLVAPLWDNERERERLHLPEAHAPRDAIQLLREHILFCRDSVSEAPIHMSLTQRGYPRR